MELAQPIVADGVFNLYNSDTYRFNLVQPNIDFHRVTE